MTTLHYVKSRAYDLRVFAEKVWLWRQGEHRIQCGENPTFTSHVVSFRWNRSKRWTAQRKFLITESEKIREV